MMTHKPPIKTQLYQGFTMVELLIIMIVITILSSTFVPNFLDLSKRRADLVVSEMLVIKQAIQTYDVLQMAGFPDNVNNCSNAITVLTNNGFLAGIATNTGSTPWGFDAKYITNCSGTTATIITLSIATNEKWATYIKNELFNATNATTTITIDGTTTTLDIIKLVNAVSPVGSEGVLYQDSAITTAVVNGVAVTDATDSPLGTYVAKGNIYMDGFTLYGQEPSNERIAFFTVSEPLSVTSPNTKQIVLAVNAIRTFTNVTFVMNSASITLPSSSDVYGYAQFRVLVELAGNYTLSSTPDSGSVILEISSSLGVTYDTTMAINLVEGEIIEVKIYYHTDNINNGNMALRVIPPGTSTLMALTDPNSRLKIIENIFRSTIHNKLLYRNDPSGTYIAKGNIDMDGFSIYNANPTFASNILPTIDYNFANYTLASPSITLPVTNATNIIGVTIYSDISSGKRLVKTVIFDTLRGDNILLSIQGLDVNNHIFMTTRMTISNSGGTATFTDFRYQLIKLGAGSENSTLEPGQVTIDGVIFIYDN